jgi:hypothetical protein
MWDMNIENRENGTGDPRRILVVLHSAPYLLKPLVPLLQDLERRGYDCKIILFSDKPSGANESAFEQVMGYTVEVHSNKPACDRGFLLTLARSIRLYPSTIMARWQMRRLSRQIIASYQPVAVLLTGDTGLGNASVVRVANESNIPTILIHWAFSMPQSYYDEFRSKAEQQEGKDRDSLRRFYRAIRRMAAEWLLRRLDLPFQFAHSFGGGEARRFAVMGDAFVDQFARQGVSREKMVVTGNPEHDAHYYRRLATDSATAKRHVCDELGLPLRPLAVFATAPLVGFISSDEQRRITSILVENVLESTDCSLVVKLHPRDEMDYAFVKEYGSRVAVCKEYDLIALVEACDVFISHGSSTILLAMAWGKPAVTLSFTSWTVGDYFAELGGTLLVKDPDRLSSALVSALRNDQVRERLLAEQQQVVSHYMKFDGRVVERLVSLIEGEIAESTTVHRSMFETISLQIMTRYPGRS